MADFDQKAVNGSVSCWKAWGKDRQTWQDKIDLLTLWKDNYPHNGDILTEVWEKIFGANTQKCVVLDIQSSGGGEEACFFVGELAKMYLAWATQLNVDAEIMDFGPISAVLRLEGDIDIFLNQEGLHRFVRQSPYDKNKKVHTSYVAVRLYFDAEEKDIDICKQDVRIDVMRSSGAGGQHVNKTESAVRLTHIPSGITVFCQHGRSQHRNKKTAWGILIAKLKAHEKQKIVREEKNLSRVSTYHFGRNVVSNHLSNTDVNGVAEYLQGKIV